MLDVLVRGLVGDEHDLTVLADPHRSPDAPIRFDEPDDELRRSPARQFTHLRDERGPPCVLHAEPSR